MTINELKDEIRRRDEIIESNKTLASDLIDALGRVDAGVFCINNLDFQLAASIKRVGELEAEIDLSKKDFRLGDIVEITAMSEFYGYWENAIIVGMEVDPSTQEIDYSVRVVGEPITNGYSDGWRQKDFCRPAKLLKDKDPK